MTYSRFRTVYVGLHKHNNPGELVEIQECLLQDEAANQILTTIKQYLPALQTTARPVPPPHLTPPTPIVPLPWTFCTVITHEVITPEVITHEVITHAVITHEVILAPPPVPLSRWPLGVNAALLLWWC